MKKGVIHVFTALAGAATGAAAIGTIQGKAIKNKAEKIDKFKSYYNMLNQWLILKQEGKNLAKFFADNHYKTIAIYGMGEMGNRLYDELKDTDITVKYAIDKNAASTYSELEVFELEDELEPVDAVIVTAVFAFDEIEQDLSKQIDWPIVSLEDVVYEI